MYLKGAENQAYWSAVAQIVPVLALAMAIEARILARRWSKKKNMKLRGRRWFIASAYSVLVATLPVLIFTALQNVAREETSTSDYWFALVWITASTVMVAYIPAASVVNTALIDMYWFIGRKMPWSKMRRIERLRLLYTAEVAKTGRSLRWAHTQFLTLYADHLLVAIPVAIAWDIAIEQTPGYNSRLRRDFRALQTSLKESADFYQAQMAEYAAAFRAQLKLETMLRGAANSEEKIAGHELETIRKLLERNK